jgi:hypothetical protein
MSGIVVDVMLPKLARAFSIDALSSRAWVRILRSAGDAPSRILKTAPTSNDVIMAYTSGRSF